MAHVTKVRLVDDIDGGEADESVSFGIDGRSLEIDLSSENAEKLRSVLAPYIAAARGGGRPSTRPQSLERPLVERKPVERQPVASAPVVPEPVEQQPSPATPAPARKPALPKIGNPFQVGG